MAVDRSLATILREQAVTGGRSPIRVKGKTNTMVCESDRNLEVPSATTERSYICGECRYFAWNKSRNLGSCLEGG